MMTSRLLLRVPPCWGLVRRLPATAAACSTYSALMPRRLMADIAEKQPASASSQFCQGSLHYSWSNGNELTLSKGDTLLMQTRLFGMPKGYPATVANGYQRFFFLSIASSFVSNFSASIGFQALLNGFFLGSSPQMWLLKDLFPALMATYVANRVVSYENRAKFWFVVSVFLYNVTVITDMLIPSFLPNNMLEAAICTSVVKQSSALMFMVTRATALQHFAIDNNLGELTKKFNSYGMVCYTLATALGIVFCTFVPNFTAQLCVAVGCIGLNFVLAPMSLAPIHLRVLNLCSMSLIAPAYIQNSRQMLTPSEVSDSLGFRMKQPHHFLVSPPLKKLRIDAATLKSDVVFCHHRYAFMICLLEEAGRVKRVCRQLTGRAPHPLWGEKQLVLLVQEDCTAREILLAHLLMWHASLLPKDTTCAAARLFFRDCQEKEAEWESQCEEFRAELEAAGWDVAIPLLDNPKFRFSSLLNFCDARGGGPVDAADPTG